MGQVTVSSQLYNSKSMEALGLGSFLCSTATCSDSLGLYRYVSVDISKYIRMKHSLAQEGNLLRWCDLILSIMLKWLYLGID